MSEQSDSPTPLRARGKGHTFKTPEERKRTQEAFLEYFREEANVTFACRAAKIDRDTVYDWKKRYKDFAEKFAGAEEIANDHIDHAIYTYGKIGWTEPVVSNGKQIFDERTGEPLEIHRHSDAMLTMLAKSRMAKYREKQEVDVTTHIGTMAQSAKDELLADLEASMTNEDKEQTPQE